MLNSLLIGLVFLSFFLGFYLREVLNILRKLTDKIDLLRTQEKGKPKEASFAEPMSRQEVINLIEQEKIDALNR